MRDDRHKRALLKSLLAKRAGRGETPSTNSGSGAIPLSKGQRALWYLQKLAPESFAYNVVLALRIRTPLSWPVLEGAMASLIERHQGLRVQLGDEGGRPVQRLLDVDRPRLEVVDVTGAETVEERAQAFSRRPFRLETEPPLRLALFRKEGEDSALVWLFHHLAIDFWSIGILVHDLDSLYRAGASGQPAALPEIDATYADFAAWQERRLGGNSGEQLRGFWKARLKGVETGLDLPFDRPRRAEMTFRGGTRRCDLDSELTASLRHLAERFRTTTFSSLLAVVLVLLAKLAGQRKVVVGTPVAGRSRPSFQGVVGYFVNLLPLSGEVTRGASFADLMRELSPQVAQALDHGDLPFSDIVEAVGIRRDLSRAPLCDVGFALESSKMDRLGIVPLLLGESGARTEIGGLICEGLAIPQQEGQFDLNFHFLEASSGLAGLAMYNADLLDAVTVDRWCASLLALLRGVLEQPEAILDELSPLSRAQTHQLVLEWQGPPSLAETGTVVDLFRRQVAKAPHATALEGESQQLTYRELDRRTDRLAVLLGRLGVRAEVVIGVCLESSPDLVVAELAILKAHGAYLPLDPAYPEKRRDVMLADSDAFARITSAKLAERTSELPTPVWTLEGLLDKASAGSSVPKPEEGSGVGLESLAYVIFTSGSTGRPKGVGVPHRGLPNLLRWHQAAIGIGPGDRLPNSSGPSFDPSGLEIWSALTAGATVLFPPRECRISGRRLARWLESEGVTVGSAPTPLAEALLGEELRDQAKLRSLFLGGDRLGRRPTSRAPYRVFNLYGPTEATVVAAGGRVRPEEAELPAPSLGRPIDGVDIHLLDETLRPVPLGAEGELWIGGAGVARGYLGSPAQTAASFLPDPFGEGPGKRFYHTGDTARWSADGRLLFKGRRDHQIKIRGVRIELGEVESAVRAFSGVSSAAVIDREMGPGNTALVAYIVPTKAAFEVGALKASLEAALPSVMVPAHFVTLDELPVTANGKVDRQALPAPLLPSRGEAGAESRVDAGLEGRIAAVWEQVLGLPQVSPDANFFDLGGHSLLLGELLAQLEDTLDRSLTVVQLLRYPTVRSLARFLSPDPSELGGAEARQVLLGSPSAHPGNEPVAVIGMSCRFPGAPNVEALWSLLVEGREGLRHLSADEVSMAAHTSDSQAEDSFVPVAGDLPDIELFDAGLFGLNPREAEILDPQQRLFLECAWEALEDGGSVPELADRTGVFAGIARSSYLDRHLAPNKGLAEEVGEYQLSLGNDKDFLPTRVSYLLGLKGPSINVQTACSTSLTAIHLACQSLRLGECDQALAGGVAVRLPQAAGYHFQEGMILSPDGHCRAFDAAAAGTVGANGVGVVLLKPLSRALADGDPVRAVILGSAMNNDGSLKAGYTAPAVEGQVEVLQAAYQAAQVDPGSLSFVEAHGTGTALGDPIEVAALNEVFGGKAEPASIALGSVKTNLGHLDAAAGVAGFMKAVLSLERGQLPPSLHYQSPNPEIDFDSGPFDVARQLQDLAQGNEPRRAGVSSFGIGGTNVHVVLQEPPTPVPEKEELHDRAEVLVLSAHTLEALEESRAGLAAALEGSRENAPRDVAWTLQTGRRALDHRLTVVVEAGEDAALALVDPSRRLVGKAGTEPAVAFLFPGQGAQHPGMATGLSRRSQAFARSLGRCSEILLPLLGQDLLELLAATGEEAAERLRQTAVAQPLLFALELSLAHLWSDLGIRARGMLGHSIGELVAACLAGVFSEEEGLRLAAARGSLLQALPAGSMLGVSLPEVEVMPLLPPSLALAAVNGPRSCVVSGPSEIVEELATSLRQQGVEHRVLHTSHAFHSSMMEPALEAYRRELEKVDLRPPDKPFISNVTGTWIRREEATDPEYWLRHLRGTVRCAEGLRTLASDGSPLLLEVGPGKTLGTFARQTVPGVQVVASLPHPKRADRAEETFLEAVGRLWLRGAPIRWDRWDEGGRRSKVSLPTYPFQRRRYWIEPPDPQATSRAPTDGLAVRKSVEQWLYRPAWVAAEPAFLGEPLAGEGLWLVFLDRAGLGERLADSLRSRGREVVEVRPEDAADLDAVFANLPHPPKRIVHMGAYGDLEEASDGSLEHGFLHLSALAKKVAQEGLELHIDAVTSGALRVLPEDRLDPVRAAAVGPVRVLTQERSGLGSRLVDLPLPNAEASEAVLASLEAELDVAGSDVVAWRRGQRWRHRFEPVQLPKAKSLRRQSVVLITGGLGGVGLELAGHLATAGDVRLALLSRGGLRPPGDAESSEDRARRGAVEALRKAGAEVEVIAADVSDRASLAAAIQIIRNRFGRIDGVIHAAGIAGGSMLEVMERETALEVLAPKVLGTRNLVELLPPSQLDFFLLCSSLSAVLGGVGQAAYCAANAVLDAYAESLLDKGVTSVAWDLWRDVGMAGPRRASDRRQELGMDASVARRLLDKLLGCGLARVLVSTEDLEVRRRRASEPMEADPPFEEPPSGGHDRPALATPFVPPRSETEKALAEIWGGLLGIQAIGVHDDFFELGGHSLLGTRVLSRVEARCGAKLSLSTLFRSSTVAGLAVEVDRCTQESVAEESADPSMEIDLDSLDDTAMAALLESLEAVGAGS